MVEGQKAGEGGYGARGPKHIGGRLGNGMFIFGFYVGGCLVDEGGAHLAGDHAFPDELIEFHLVLVQVGLQVVGVTEA